VISAPAYYIKDIPPSPEGQKGIFVLAGAFQGGIPAGRTVRVFPGGHRGRLKNVSSLYGDKYHLNLKGIRKKTVRKGSVIVSEEINPAEVRKGMFLCPAPFREGEQLILRPDPGLPSSLPGKPVHAIVLPVSVKNILLLEFRRSELMIPGGEYILDPPAGGDTVTALFFRKPPDTRNMWLTLENTIRDKEEFSPQRICSLLVLTESAVFCPPGLRDSIPEDLALAGNILMNPDDLKSRTETIQNLSRRQGGVSKKEAADKCGLAPEIIKSVLDSMRDSGLITVRSGHILDNVLPAEEKLSPAGRDLYDFILKKGEKGVRTGTLRKKYPEEMFGELERMGLILADSRSLIACSAAEKLIDAVSAAREKNPELTLSALSEETGIAKDLLVLLTREDRT
jgi:hypothetical protein